MSNEETLRAFLTAHNGGWDFDGALPLASIDFVAHMTGSPDLPSRDAWQEATEAFAKAFPDYSLEVHDIVCHGDLAAARFTWRGTHVAEMNGIPASGARVEVSGISLVRFEDGLLVEEWVEQNNLALLQQIGAIPAG
jgi:steroid delta-isomerase-like uncharacterized protein